MRQLHVVALSEDGRYVLLGTSKNATEPAFRVPLEGRLTAAVRGELPRPGQSAPPVEAVTPKEIQARLRAGETVEEIARSAGVPTSRVERFAGPVEGEKARIVAAARLAVLNRPRRGASAVPLGEAVDHHLAETSQLDPASVVWDARKLEDGSWVVDLTYTVRGKGKAAAWRYTPSTREVAAHDAASSVLGYVDPEDKPKSVVAAVVPTRRRRTAASSRAPRSVAAAGAPAAAKAPAKKKSAPKARPAGSAPARPAAAAPAPTVRPAPQVRPAAAPARPAATRPAAPAARVTAPAARVEPPAAARRPVAPPRPAAAAPVEPPAAAAPPVEPAPTPESPPQLRVVPPPVEEKRGRAVVPGWADVLLSTTPPARREDPEQDAD